MVRPGWSSVPSFGPDGLAAALLCVPVDDPLAPGGPVQYALGFVHSGHHQRDHADSVTWGKPTMTPAEPPALAGRSRCHSSFSPPQY